MGPGESEARPRFKLPLVKPPNIRERRAVGGTAPRRQRRRGLHGRVRLQDVFKQATPRDGVLASTSTVANAPRTPPSEKTPCQAGTA
jgi:hypothetical protein